jgi:hypothetical protein
MKPSSANVSTSRAKRLAGKKAGDPKREARYSVALASNLVQRVEKFAQGSESSMSKAIAALVKLGLDGEAERKREFMRKLRSNLAAEEELVDEFRDLILGR